MKIAAISDIHGNLTALEAVLEDIAARGVDLTVNLGDIVSGPLRPRATALRLMELGLPTIRGNHERQLLAPDRAGMGSSDRFAADALTPLEREWVRLLPATLWVADDVFLCHATPANDVDCFLENIEGGALVAASLDQIASRAAPCTASLILCGHSHIPKIAYRDAHRVIVNPGSVGIQAYAGHHPLPHVLEMGSPHARYAIAERGPAGWTVQLIGVAYDWESAARLAERHGRPEWARPLRTGYL